MNRIWPAAAVAFAVVSTGVAVAFAASMPPPNTPQPTPAGLAPQTYVSTTVTTTSTVLRVSSSSATPSSSRAGVVQLNVVPAEPADTTTTTEQLPVACIYPPAAPQPPDWQNPSAPQRTPAPTPTVTAVIPPKTCPPYVAYP